MKIKNMKLNFNRKGSCLTVLGIGIIIINTLINMAVPNFPRTRYSARLKACFSNQRIIQGAVEMYNMDNTIPIETALPGQAFEQCEELLVKERYLKNYIDLIEPECSYGFFDIVGSGTIFCKKHGSCELYYQKHNSDDIAMPSYDNSLEIPFSHQYLEKRNKRIKEKEMRDFSNRVYSNIFNVLFSPVTGLLLGVILVAADIIKSSKNEDIAE